MKTTSFTSTQRELARNVLHLYRNDPERWSQRAHARNNGGEVVKIRDCTACAWCLAGAVMFVSDDWLESIEVISEALQAYTSDPIVEACGVAAWNDAPMRTFADVRNFLQAVAA